MAVVAPVAKIVDNIQLEVSYVKKNSSGKDALCILSIS